MVVSSYYFICSHTKLMDTLYFAVQRRVRPQAVKKEPKSPDNSTSSKWKVYSTNSANPIGSIHPIDIDFDASQQGSSKRQKTASSGSSNVRFDGVIVPANVRPASRPTRQSTRSTKTTPKKEVHGLFTWLSQEFWAAAKTCEDIAEALDWWTRKLFVIYSQ